MKHLLLNIALGLGFSFSTIHFAYADNVWTPWKDLANHKPAQAALIKARTDRGHDEKSYNIQKISEGSGDAINVDKYMVNITRLPNGWNKEKFFEYARSNLNNFFDQSISVFRPFSSADKTDWESGSNAQLGTIMVFKIKTGLGTFDDGAVVVSRTGDLSWIFSPIDDGFTGNFGTHPVAGNRHFGLREADDGSLEFFTRAFDRVYPVHVSLNQGAAFRGADALWRSLQTKLAAYVNANGGAASILEPDVPGKNVPKDKPQYSVVCADPEIDLDC